MLTLDKIITRTFKHFIIFFEYFASASTSFKIISKEMRTNQTKESWSLSQYFLSRGQNFNWSSQPSFSKVRRKEMESSIREVDCFSLLILFSKIFFLLSTNERTTRLKLVLKNSSTYFIAILLTFSVMNTRKSQKVFRLPLKMTTDI